MTIEIRMPKLTDNMEEGTVIRWIVGAGQSVARGDAIAEVETDKANVEIESDHAGVVSEIVVAEGEVAAVGAVLAVLGDEAGGEVETTAAAGAASSLSAQLNADRGRSEANEAKHVAPPAVSERKDDGAGDGAKATASGATTRHSPVAAVPPQAARQGGDKPLASPVARALAGQQGVDLAKLRGSGPGGRIVKSDVEAAMTKDDPPASAPQPAAAKSGERPTAEPEGGDVPAVADEPMSRMRRTIAARMEKSKREIPHFYVRTEVDAGDLMKLYETMRGDEMIAGLTVTHLLLRAIAVVLPHHARLNALWVDDSIQLSQEVNIGIVVALDDGLVVPVVKRAQELGLRELVESARALVERARKGVFRADDLVGGTISVSNIGMLDVDELTPIINAPQASILGVGGVRDRALVRDGQLVAGRVLTLTLACDHRIVNGVEAGRFLQDLKHSLERPVGLVVERG